MYCYSIPNVHKTTTWLTNESGCWDLGSEVNETISGTSHTQGLKVSTNQTTHHRQQTHHLVDVHALRHDVAWVVVVIVVLLLHLFLLRHVLHVTVLVSLLQLETTTLTYNFFLRDTKWIAQLGTTCLLPTPKSDFQYMPKSHIRNAQVHSIKQRHLWI